MATGVDDHSHLPNGDRICSVRSVPQLVSLQRPERAARLTVHTQAKVAEYAELKAEREKKSVVGWVVLKWIMTCFICVGFLACLVFSKVSGIKLAEELYRNGSSSESGNAAAKGPVTLVMLMISLCIPYAVGFLVAAWNGLGRPDVPWPCGKAILIGILCSTCEVAGLCIYVVIVIPRVLDEGHYSMVLMNSIFFLPIIKHAVYDPIRHKYAASRSQDAYNPITPRTMAVYMVALLFQVAGQVVLAIRYLLCHSGAGDCYDNEVKLCIVSSLLLVSLAWMPVLQKLQLRPAINDIHRVRIGQSANETNGLPTQSEEPSTNPKKYSARWKACLITNVYKLLLTPGTAIFIVYIRHRINPAASFPVQSLALVVDNFVCEATQDSLDWFIMNTVSSFVGYLLGLLACMMCMQKGAFALPLTLATPFSLSACYLMSHCDNSLRTVVTGKCQWPTVDDLEDTKWVVPAALCLWIAQLLSTVIDIFQSQPIVMEKEGNLFWLNGYNGIFLEQWMLLGRKTHRTDNLRQDPKETRKRVRVFICTTMYREEEHEMEQLLESLAGINQAQLRQRNFEAHIFFDNGVKGKKLTEFALQLVSLVNRTLDVNLSHCTKQMTPYGMSLSWLMPGGQSWSASGMKFSIHLKDNSKVKNKKRWSQIMYMSLVLDYLLQAEAGQGNDVESFILTTDADVKFTQDSVEALLDLMMRNTEVGAVCARTYPMGSGPVVWYQIFDYAIGHWFQKAAEHIMGTVLCCPGCFSVYRVKALRQVLPLYASKVNRASEFLTKDMGEDRWLCTLMVQAGWRLEYSAIAVDGTHCPEEFDEFYKQRRRWIPSTLANQLLLLQEWSLARAFNPNITIFFLLYQGLLLFSTLITPSMTVLVISGGLEYGWGVPSVATIVIMLLIILGYGCACLYLSGDTQLTIAKWLTFISAIIMSAVGIGIAVQVAGELAGGKCMLPAQSSSDGLWDTLNSGSGNTSLEEVTTMLPPCAYTPVIPGTQINFSTLYLAVLVGMFLLTGLLHPTEFSCLLHGIWYWLCLPSGYLILMVYSLCNITDNSWGTREDKSNVMVDGNSSSFMNKFLSFFYKVFYCCKPAAPPDPASSRLVEERPSVVGGSALLERPDNVSRSASILETEPSAAAKHIPEPHIDENHELLFATQDHFRFPGEALRPRHLDGQTSHAATEEWLREIDPHFEELYARKFKVEGYTDISFIAGISDSDLKAIHIENDFHRKILLDWSQHLEETDVDIIVPKDPSDWLETLALGEYQQVFMANYIRGEKGLERLKNMRQKEIEQILKIRKRGHMRRLLQGIRCLRYPTERENRIRAARGELDQVPSSELSVVNLQEAEFWESLIRACLMPEPIVFGHEGELKKKLVDLRNSTLMAFVVTNTLWLILILTLDFKVALYINGSNPLGVAFLFIFGFVMLAQFACMVCHRITTGLHLVARAPFQKGRPWISGFSFSPADATSDEVVHEVGPDELESVREHARQNRPVRRSRPLDASERTPLLSDRDDIRSSGRIV